MPAALAVGRLLGAGLLSVTEISGARAALAVEGEAEKLFKPEEGPEEIVVPVSSSAISSIGWHQNDIISVTFNRGGTYTYDGSYELFQAFIAAPSKGQFFNQFFK